MDENTIIDQLEELIKSFGVQIRREPIKQDEDLVKVVGALCLLRGKYMLIINSKATTMERINTLATALKHSISIRSIYDQFSGSYWTGYLSKPRSNKSCKYPLILKEV